jgi:hypothetical protein
MVFVADDLGAWLVAALADAGARRLTTSVFGTDRQRALNQAATAAVRLTAEELCSGDSEQAEQLAMVISQVFNEPIPELPETAQATLLEALQAGIARQLAVLEDASLTGTELSSAGVLGIPAGTMAEKLTGHLMQEIVTRGARGYSSHACWPADWIFDLRIAQTRCHSTTTCHLGARTARPAS